MKEWIVARWKDYGERIRLFFGVFLVGALCFEAGMLQGKMTKKDPLILTIPTIVENAVSGVETVPAGTSVTSQSRLITGMEPVVAVEQKTGQCVFVGSKNSNKYHLATCAVAKRIKPENKLCFSSKEEAEKRGYVPSCLK